MNYLYLFMSDNNQIYTQKTYDNNEYKCCIYTYSKKGSIGKIICNKISSTIIYIRCLYIDTKYRGLGYGCMLITEAITYFYSQGIEYIKLDVEENMEKYGRLVNFYKLFGFVEKDIEKKNKLIYHEDATYRVVPMIKVLEL